jgi:hypothetical protein
MSWILTVTAGVWLLFQVFGGDLLGRLNLL